MRYTPQFLYSIPVVVMYLHSELKTVDPDHMASYHQKPGDLDQCFPKRINLGSARQGLSAWYMYIENTR